VDGWFFPSADGIHWWIPREPCKVGRLSLKLIVRMRRAFLQGGVSASDGLMNRE
jgi:hypothetical protein